MTDDLIAHLRRTAEKLGGSEAVAEVDTLGKRIDRYSNLPGVIKGLGKLDFSQAVVDAALQTVRGPSMREPGALQRQTTSELFETWAVILLAARADSAVLDEVEAALTGDDYVPKRIRELRKVTDKALARRVEQATQGTQATSAPAADDVPPSIGKVKAWLAAHPDVDPAVLAPRPKQKAATTAAAVRALGRLVPRRPSRFSPVTPRMTRPIRCSRSSNGPGGSSTGASTPPRCCCRVGVT